MIDISVIIPVYNKIRTIERCLSSILNQDGIDYLEIIAVDDYSTDGSYELLLTKREDIPNLKVYRTPRNQGPMMARHQGVATSVGKYIVFCDADDTLPSHALSSLYKVAESNNADIVCGRHRIIQLNGEGSVLSSNSTPQALTRQEMFMALLSWEIPQSLCGKIFNSSLFKSSLEIIEGQKHGEDGWLLYQLIGRAEQIRLIDDIVYHYIMDIESTTHLASHLIDFDQVIRSVIARVSIANRYNEDGQLSRAISRHLILNRAKWISEGWSSKDINRLLEANGLFPLVSLSNTIRCLSIIELIKFCIKLGIYTLREIWKKKFV